MSLNANMRKIQDDIEREIPKLGTRLDAPAMADDSIRRMRHVIRAEALRCTKRNALRRAVRPWIGLAAAALLAAALKLPAPARYEPFAALEPDADPNQVVSEWEANYDDTSRRITWLRAGWPMADIERVEGTDQDDALDVIEDSFQQLEELLGA